MQTSLRNLDDYQYYGYDARIHHNQQELPGQQVHHPQEVNLPAYQDDFHRQTNITALNVHHQFALPSFEHRADFGTTETSVCGSTLPEFPGEQFANLYQQDQQQYHSAGEITNRLALDGSENPNQSQNQNQNPLQYQPVAPTIYYPNHFPSETNFEPQTYSLILSPSNEYQEATSGASQNGPGLEQETAQEALGSASQIVSREHYFSQLYNVQRPNQESSELDSVPTDRSSRAELHYKSLDDSDHLYQNLQMVDRSNGLNPSHRQSQPQYLDLNRIHQHSFDNSSIETGGLPMKQASHNREESEISSDTKQQTPGYEIPNFYSQSLDSTGQSSITHSHESQSSAASIMSSEDSSVMNRDERKARENNLPMSYHDIVNLSIEQFNEQLARCTLTETQLGLAKDIRRRGKNKVAAQSCRKRKMEQISELQREVNQKSNEKSSLRQRCTRLKKKHEDLVRLYDEVQVRLLTKFDNTN